MSVKDIAGVIKDIATTIAILGAGVWTVYTFSALGTQTRAQAELSKQAVVEVSVEAKQESVNPGANGRLMVTAVATVINKGTRNTLVDFRDRRPFKVSRIVFDSDGVGGQDHLEELGVNTNYLTLRTGASGRFPVFFTVPAPGVYVIEFEVLLSEEELKEHEKIANDAARENGTPIVWSGNTYVVVQDFSTQRPPHVKPAVLSLPERFRVYHRPLGN